MHEPKLNSREADPVRAAIDMAIFFGVIGAWSLTTFELFRIISNLG
jgi:hypothetical protein